VQLGHLHPSKYLVWNHPCLFCQLESRNGGYTLGPPLLLPASFHGETAKKDGLGTSGCGSSNGLDAFGDAPEVANHADAALMDMKHGRVFIIVAKILGDVLHDQFVLKR
jgi:hypothetical protein